jgi:hypothetical protein
MREPPDTPNVPTGAMPVQIADDPSALMVRALDPDKNASD